MWKTYRFGDFEFDARSGELCRAGEPVPLAPKASVLLSELLASAGELLTKGDLMQRVWPDAVVSEDSLKVRVNELRTALGDTPAEARYIATVVRRGYRFVAEVEDVTPRPADPTARPSLAVLGFEAGDDPALRTLAEGVATRLIAALLDWGELPIVAPDSSQREPNVRTRGREAARALGAGLSIEGRAAGSGDRVRIVWELAETETGACLSAGHRDFEDTDLLAVQDLAADLITNAVRSNYARAGTSSRTGRDATTRQSFDYNLLGQRARLKRSAEGHEEARRHPRCARARSRLRDAPRRPGGGLR